MTDGGIIYLTGVIMSQSIQATIREAQGTGGCVALAKFLSVILQKIEEFYKKTKQTAMFVLRLQKESFHTSLLNIALDCAKLKSLYVISKCTRSNLLCCKRIVSLTLPKKSKR